MDLVRDLVKQDQNAEAFFKMYIYNNASLEVLDQGISDSLWLKAVREYYKQKLPGPLTNLLLDGLERRLQDLECVSETTQSSPGVSTIGTRPKSSQSKLVQKDSKKKKSQASDSSSTGSSKKSIRFTSFIDRPSLDTLNLWRSVIETSPLYPHICTRKQCNTCFLAFKSAHVTSCQHAKCGIQFHNGLFPHISAQALVQKLSLAHAQQKMISFTRADPTDWQLLSPERALESKYWKQGDDTSVYSEGIEEALMRLLAPFETGKKRRHQNWADEEEVSQESMMSSDTA